MALLLSNAAGFVTALALAAGLGWIMLKQVRQAEAADASP
jgi:hypothetical protein